MFADSSTKAVVRPISCAYKTRNKILFNEMSDV